MSKVTTRAYTRTQYDTRAPALCVHARARSHRLPRCTCTRVRFRYTSVVSGGGALRAAAAFVSASAFGRIRSLFAIHSIMIGHIRPGLVYIHSSRLRLCRRLSVVAFFRCAACGVPPTLDPSRTRFVWQNHPNGPNKRIRTCKNSPAALAYSCFALLAQLDLLALLALLDPLVLLDLLGLLV